MSQIRRQQNRLAMVVEDDRSSEQDEDETDFVNVPVLFRKKKPPPIPNNVSVAELPTTVNAQLRHSYLVLKNIVFPTNYNNDPSNRETFLSETSTVAGGRGRHFGYLTIRILFWDILISFLDTVSDFAQGVVLYSTPEKRLYGVFTLAINWIPGIPAAIHLVSMYRTEFPWYCTLLYAALLIVLYPIVPILAFANLLWMKPKPGIPISEDSFREAEYRSVIAHAISGCIESPIQIIYQMWLVINGVVLLKWDEVTSLSITDWEGNTVFLPITASVCTVLSIIAVIKASIEVNLIRVHIDGILTWRHWLLEFVPIIFDHLPLLASGTFFRISSLILIMSYLNSFGFISIAAFWILNIVISQITFGTITTKIPLWLISFIALFIPVCLTTKNITRQSSRKRMIELQYKVFMRQSLLAFVLYSSSLIAMAVIVNQPSSDFRYNPDIVLNNWSFNMSIGAVLGMGVTTTLLACFSPSSTKLFDCCSKSSKQDKKITSKSLDPKKQMTSKLSDQHKRSSLDEVDSSPKASENGESARSKVLKLAWSLIMFGLAVSPVVAALMVYTGSPSSVVMTSYVFYKPSANHTKIVQATTLNEFDKVIFGTTKDLLHKGIDDDGVEDGDLDFGRNIEKDNNNNNNNNNNNIFTKDQAAEEKKRQGGRADVVLVSRSLWDLKRDQIMSNLNPSAVVITDSERLRPSSPLPNIGLVDPDIPVLLVRLEDKDELPYDRDSVPIWLSPRNESIPDPEWACQLPFGRACLSRFFNEEGYIVGKQLRKKECTWGGHACVGYSNEQEEQSYCNGPETEVCPYDQYQGMGNFKVYTFPNGIKRSMRFNPITSAPEFYSLVEECDRGTSLWSNWLGWKIDLQDRDKVYRSRRRYCDIIHKNCLLEELMRDECCDFDFEEEEGSLYPSTSCKNQLSRC